MKQCPVCRTTYPDPTLRFCLADGAQLIEDAGEPTLVRHAEPIRVDIAGRGQPTQPVNLAAPPTGSMSSLLKVLIGLFVLGIFVIIVTAGAAFIYLNRGDDAASPISANQNIKTAPSPTSSAAADETDELKDQIANLEKLLNQQKRSDQPSNIPLTLPNQPAATATARVHSPGDGFLALRTYPNSQAGTRVLQIPHGAIISVGGCLNVTKIGKRSGRWCRANHDGYSGWVFDAFLIY